MTLKQRNFSLPHIYQGTKNHLTFITLAMLETRKPHFKVVSFSQRGVKVHSSPPKAAIAFILCHQVAYF